MIAKVNPPTLRSSPVNNLCQLIFSQNMPSKEPCQISGHDIGICWSRHADHLQRWDKANHLQLSNKVGKGGSFRTSTKGYANKSLPIHLLGIHGCVLLNNGLLKGAEDPQVCKKKTISYICPYLIASVVHHQIYTVVMITIYANMEKIV